MGIELSEPLVSEKIGQESTRAVCFVCDFKGHVDCTGLFRYNLLTAASFKLFDQVAKGSGQFQ